MTSEATYDVDALRPFESPRLPASSRVNHSVPQTSRRPVGVLNAWKYLSFAAGQASHIAQAFVSHHVYGPAKPSWGIEMTLFTTFLRNSVSYSHLSSIELLRRVLDLGQILPTPKDGIVTPVAFNVKRRGLKGFLADADAKETGQRELTAEWVINRKLWKEMQEHYRRSGTHVSKEQVIFYLHGGAYYVMSAASHRFLTIQISKYTDARLFALNYRLSPETKFPGALLDAVNGYFRLVYDLKIPSENIVVAGDSAGAGLCAALLLYLRDEGYPLPSGAILMSPWVDLTMSCSSWDTNAEFDYLPQPADDDHLHPVKCYFAADEIAKCITHPYASPLFGDFHGIPPLLIQCGDAERLRDEGTLLAHKASLAGVQVEHEIYEDCVHVFQMFGFLEASRKALRSIRRFVKQTLSDQRPMEQSQIDSVILAGAHAVRDTDAKLEPSAFEDTDEASKAESDRVAQKVEADRDAGSQAALGATRKALDLATDGKASKPTPSPASPSRVLRRLTSSSQVPVGSPPRTLARRSSDRDGSLRVRPRSNSHPSLRALMDEFSRSNSDYHSDSEGETTTINTRLNSSSTTASPT